jgi:hypothetical protein
MYLTEWNLWKRHGFTVLQYLLHCVFTYSLLKLYYVQQCKLVFKFVTVHYCKIFYVKIQLIQHIYVKNTLFTLCTLPHFSPQGAILREYWYILWAGSTKTCPEVNIWKAKYMYMQVALTVKYNIQGGYTYNLKPLKIKMWKYEKYKKTMIIILIQINDMMRVGNTYRVKEQHVVCT